ncbi:hypothetical protein SAMN04515671_1377 [Nakamurella panacisegetis]|uniref:Uncharacterized protein n=1 Tax=Nakamurella panacisegetis TaxID=1090615 RepID=A0A1H0KNL1_9ACTN|nr:hypothetical protein [Nakamurella panacisegetis]SDO57340.1 hypothetical protein SAMN04515671_1377 [Nakamurella panacisegetis]
MVWATIIFALVLILVLIAWIRWAKRTPSAGSSNPGRATFDADVVGPPGRDRYTGRDRGAGGLGL